MPYFHYETDNGRREMTQAIKRVTYPRTQRPESVPNHTVDEKLIRAYLHSNSDKQTAPLHVRRTLDQFFYSTLDDTDFRDQDQVVYRFTEKSEPVILMIDQLWLWIIDEG